MFKIESRHLCWGDEEIHGAPASLTSLASCTPTTPKPSQLSAPLKRSGDWDQGCAHPSLTATWKYYFFF